MTNKKPIAAKVAKFLTTLQHSIMDLGDGK